jgi:hypothetical protein
MKTLIIPDIHTKFVLAEKIITHEKPDNIVFLGDYFDSYGDSLDITEKTAMWLKESLHKENRIHLLGNHDLSYLDSKFPCSGFTEAKLSVIQKTGLDLSKLVHYCWVGEFLCTHAGLSNEFYQKYGNSLSVDDFLKKYSTNKKLRARLYDCSPFRGGIGEFAGIVWCDYNEFVDIQNIKQIFGHTRGSLRKTEQHICLDTELHNYALFEKEMEIKETNDRFYDI